MKKLELFCFVLMNVATSFGQVSIPANNGGAPTDYVGWDINTFFRLPISHEATFPIDFFTSAGAGTFNNQRMTIFEDNILSPDNTSYNVGRVGIREDGTRWNFDPLPASLLHLGHGWPIGAGGHRSWMDVGTFGTAGTDMTYFGLKNQFFGNEGQPWGNFMDAAVS